MPTAAPNHGAHCGRSTASRTPLLAPQRAAFLALPGSWLLQWGRTASRTRSDEQSRACHDKDAKRKVGPFVSCTTYERSKRTS